MMGKISTEKAKLFVILAAVMGVSFGALGSLGLTMILSGDAEWFGAVLVMVSFVFFYYILVTVTEYVVDDD
tara:strand:- start:3419 stop:3631 length:213 start_codon:yes stop_codon:yes gene_type:complete